MAKDAMHYAKKQELWALIKVIGRRYGEDDEILKAYGKEVYEAQIDDLDVPLACFRDLVQSTRWMDGKKNPWNRADGGSDRRVSTDP
jgi:hypothetical protein